MTEAVVLAPLRLDGNVPLLLDAAMGTELQRRGADTRLPLWSARALIEAPELVFRIHREDAAAGADILTANTFRTHRRTLERGRLGARASELTRLAVQLARDAAAEESRDVRVAGSLAPLEDCYRPDLVPDDRELEREHAEQADALAEAGADLLLLETHNTVRELAAAAAAAARTGLPFVASMVTTGAGRLLSGEPIAQAVVAVAPLAPAALGINCVAASRLGADVRELALAGRGIPFAAYGNLGLPADDTGWSFTEELSPFEYAAIAARWLDSGAAIIGGCCGTTPAHTAELRRLLDMRARPPQPISIASPKE